MPNLTKAACELSILNLFSEAKFCYLWTYTFPDDVLPVEAARRWRLFVRWHVETGKKCVRVLESGSLHGRWHYHCVTPNRWDVNEVREAAQRCGFGRINVKRIPATRARYVAKYLNKSSRVQLAKGQRRWACVGFNGVPVNRVRAKTRTLHLPKEWTGRAYTAVEWEIAGFLGKRVQIRKAETPEAELVQRLYVSREHVDALIARGDLFMLGEYRGLTITERTFDAPQTAAKIRSVCVEHRLGQFGDVRTITEWLPSDANVDAVTLPATPGMMAYAAVDSFGERNGYEFCTGIIKPLVSAGTSHPLSPQVAEILCMTD